MFKKAIATVALGSMLAAATPAQAGETEDILGVLAIGAGIALLASDNDHRHRDRGYDDRGYNDRDYDRGYYDRGARSERGRVNPYNDPAAPGYARGYDYSSRTCYSEAQRGYGGRVRRVETNCYGDAVAVDRFYRRGY